MKCSSVIQELIDWAIDRPDSRLPERLQNHLNDCLRCRSEWESIQGWTQLLRPTEESWKPEEGYYERLTEQAMREKRRAVLTRDIRRDLALDASGWFSLFQRPAYRWAPTLAVLLLIVLPCGWWIQYSIDVIGQFDYSSGQVMAMADKPLDPRKGMHIRRSTTVQTPQNSESIVLLESGAEICIAPLSRVTFLDEKTVRLDHGRAYFDIAKQESGFQVLLPQGAVKVLGTAFHISVAQGRSAVIVTRGVVQVSNANAAEKVFSGMECNIAPSLRPSTPKPSTRILAQTRWVNQVREDRNQEELRKYYPSLAAPKPKESQP
ncbi:MAG: FecR domain-containing protein [Candidatus Omnitrophica bacterium]|nr:FecR domain-containing protein [Candidatus Omnitrophota bacterium]